ncbi:MAG: acetylxylan esterase [Armatimonadetes bacterium]|nr:acetylxylan esterase [Armatimonadota bacterium]
MLATVALLVHTGLALLTKPAAAGLSVEPVPSSGIVPAGTKAAWSVRLADPAPGSRLRFVVKANGLTELRQGFVEPSADGTCRIEGSMDSPGWLLLEVEAGSADQPAKALGGLAFSPERIRPSLPRPQDFDAFWRSKLSELSKVPANAKLERADSGVEGVSYFKVQMDNIRGSKIYGQLAKPDRPGRFPAMLIVQWAGVYPLHKDWILGRAKAGFLVLNIMAHDLPFDRPQSFYDEQAQGPLNNYPAIGNDDRETSYFLRMYLSCYRAAEYLTSRSDWDGKTLVVTGGSQGGMQTIVTAALHPKVTAGIADVPAGCDLNGPVAGRAPGWPMWYWQTQGKDPERVRRAAGYYDVVNFAPRVRCPILVGLGLIDTTCPPPGVFAMVNSLAGPKEVVAMPTAGHGGDHSAFHRRSEEWLAAILRGGRPPVREWGREASRGL